MKRWLVCLILICFIGASSISQALIVGISRVSSAPAGSCMSGTYLFAWDGSHTSGTDFACDGSANPIDGAVNGSIQIGTDYGEGGADVAIRIDADMEYLEWADSAGALVDLNGAQTVWMRIYVSAAPTGDTRVFESSYDGTNYVSAVVKSGLNINGTHRIGGDAPTVWGEATTAGGWVDVAYSWDKPNQDHASYSAGQWNEDLNVLSASTGTDITGIHLGSYYGFSMGAGESVRITKIAVVNGHKAAKPW